MREVNFSIPNVNKASVGITTALYDRRALDCTSTLPLINSLNHLAYLTTSSARIRDILTVDGGVERLVCILKDGRSRDLMNMWKWNLAFQCVVNIGVRGSENVRTRVVEADMVPVIATILDNYIQVFERQKSRADANSKRGGMATLPATRLREPRPSAMNAFDRPTDRPTGFTSHSVRRQPPPPSIEIPVPFPSALPQDQASSISDTTPTPAAAVSATADRPLSARPQYSHHRSNSALSVGGAARQGLDSIESFGFRPVRDADRLPSMGTSQPESPTTPNPISTQNNIAAITTIRLPRRQTRPAIHHRRSMSNESVEDVNVDEVSSNASGGGDSNNAEPIVDLQPGVISIRTGDGILDSEESQMTLERADGTQETETFNITHRSPIDGSLLNPAGNTADPVVGFSPVPPAAANVPPVIPPPNYPRLFFDSPAQQVVLPSMPREDDVLMSLQLLAYVSKYTNLRTYFQKSHLVPNLSINGEIHLLDEMEGRPSASPKSPVQPIEEYLVPDDFNIFPLVEKFTVRHHPPDMQYWAGVVMRNLCRKDDSKGGIRQCAYFQCGKWEEYTRQFAKCRRCRRTKYCSKECQKSAWVYHRHWCVAAQT